MTKREYIKYLESKGEYRKAQQLREHDSPMGKAINRITDLPFDIADAGIQVAKSALRATESTVRALNPFNW